MAFDEKSLKMKDGVNGVEELNSKQIQDKILNKENMHDLIPDQHGDGASRLNSAKEQN